jgi:hypothetical protein
MIVVGDRELEQRTGSVRSHERGDLGALPIGELPGTFSEHG